MTSRPRFKGVYYRDHEKSAVDFEVKDSGAIVFLDEQNQDIRIPLHRVHLDLIGDDRTTLQIGWKDQAIDCLLLCHDPQLLTTLLQSNLPAPLQQQLQDLEKQRHKNHTREKNRVSVYLAGIMAFFLTGYLSIHGALPFVVDLIPPEWEKQIGEFAFENYQLGKKTLDSPAVIQAVEEIVQRIDRFDNMDLSYELIVIDAEMINAFAFPGGYIVVTSGLLKNADAPEEVAGVLAHELTHVIERHGMKKLVRQAGLGVLIGIVFGDVSALSQLIELGAQLDSLSFDRDQEDLADEGAIQILQAASISPAYLAHFFEKIEKADAVTGDIPELFRTHPVTEDRINRVKQSTEPTRPYHFDMDWPAVKKAVQTI